MSPRLRAALYAQAGAVFSLHPCLYAGDRPTAGRSRFATLLPGDAAVSPSNGDHAGTQRADPPPPRNGPKHRGAGRSRSATGPPRQSRSTRQFFCAEVLAGLLRQSVFGRLAGYEDVNDAERLHCDPAMRWVVGDRAISRSAASASQMGRFETKWLCQSENLAALAGLPSQWIDKAHERRSPKTIVLEMDSSESPTYNEQEGSSYKGHFEGIAREAHSAA